jgi:hypothetical protein
MRDFFGARKIRDISVLEKRSFSEDQGVIPVKGL